MERFSYIRVIFLLILSWSAGLLCNSYFRYSEYQGQHTDFIIPSIWIQLSIGIRVSAKDYSLYCQKTLLPFFSPSFYENCCYLKLKNNNCASKL